MAVDQDDLEVVTDEVADEVKELDKGLETEATTDDEELQVQIGEDAPPQEEVTKAPEWARELRKSYREAQKRIRELETQTVVKAPDAPQEPTKPTLAEFDFDEEKFDKAMENYHSAKYAKAERQRAAEAQASQEREKVDQVRKQYTESTKALKVKDYQDMEDEVVSTLSEAQQGLILGGADKPALLVYALGKNPEKLRLLSSIKDPVKFAFAAAKLEKDLKVSNRKTEKPMPESTLKSSASGSASNATLDRLRAEAQRTGDMSKVLAFKQKLRKP